MPTLETERLILRSFHEEDVDVMAQLFANPDFMRFSSGVFTEREQTIAFIEKVMGWDHAGIPSQFAVVPRDQDAIIGYCGFFYHPEHGIEDIEIGYRLNPITGTAASLPKPRALFVITAFVIGSWRASSHSFIQKISRPVAWQRKME